MEKMMEKNRQINVKHFAIQANAKTAYMHESLKHSVINHLTIK